MTCVADLRQSDPVHETAILTAVLAQVRAARMWPLSQDVEDALHAVDVLLAAAFDRSVKR